MRKLLALTALLIAVLVTALIAALMAALPSGASHPGAHVRVGDLFFEPAKVTIESGESVRWRWVGEAQHNVTVTRGPVKFESENKTSGRYKKKLTRTGTYRYVCTIHRDDMKGKIVVE
jgi:plastocyanin